MTLFLTSLPLTHSLMNCYSQSFTVVFLPSTSGTNLPTLGSSYLSGTIYYKALFKDCRAAQITYIKPHNLVAAGLRCSTVGGACLAYTPPWACSSAPHALGMVVPAIPAHVWLWQGHQECKAILSFLVGLRTPWTTRDSVYKQNNHIPPPPTPQWTHYKRGIIQV